MPASQYTSSKTDLTVDPHQHILLEDDAQHDEELQPSQSRSRDLSITSVEELIAENPLDSPS